MCGNVETERRDVGDIVMKEMTDREVIKHLRNYVKSNHGLFSWPTDACGYDQHIKFVKYRNKYFKGDIDFNEFILGYVDKLEKEKQNG